VKRQLTMPVGVVWLAVVACAWLVTMPLLALLIKVTAHRVGAGGLAGMAALSATFACVVVGGSAAAVALRVRRKHSHLRASLSGVATGGLISLFIYRLYVCRGHGGAPRRRMEGAAPAGHRDCRRAGTSPPAASLLRRGRTVRTGAAGSGAAPDRHRPDRHRPDRHRPDRHRRDSAAGSARGRHPTRGALPRLAGTYPTSVRGHPVSTPLPRR
jgi:hypothetical protein